MPMREQLEQLVHEMVTRGIRYDEAQREFEKKFIMQVLLKADGNLGKAADLLGIHRNTLARKITEYRLRRTA
jgi:Fis family transcriptional regulator, factor for inversion stimulation protein